MPDFDSQLSRGSLGALNSGVSKALKEVLQNHNQLLNRYRSIDDIVKEGSNPSASSMFGSTSNDYSKEK